MMRGGQPNRESQRAEENSDTGEQCQRRTQREDDGVEQQREEVCSLHIVDLANPKEQRGERLPPTLAQLLASITEALVPVLEQRDEHPDMDCLQCTTSPHMNHLLIIERQVFKVPLFFPVFGC